VAQLHEAVAQCAALVAVRNFERVGYTVATGASDWIFGPQDRDIQLEVLAGFAGAAAELDDLPATAIAGWLARRRKLVAAGQSSMRVGHIDFLATPTGWR